MVTLDSLSEHPRWVAWRNEPRGNGATKVPYVAVGRCAKSNDPSTWVIRADAEHLAKHIVNGEGGGIGIELGTHEGITIAGVDLDTCIDPITGAVEPWAMEVIERLGTYAEVSPSGTGIKCYYQYDPADLAALRAEMGGSTGRKWSRGQGAHAPAIELHLSHRYYAVTGNHLPDTPQEMRMLPREIIGWIINEAGPAFAGGKATSANADDRGDAELRARIEDACRTSPTLARRWAGDWSGLSDSSRSGRAMSLLAALRHAGFEYEEAGTALRLHSDGSLADWVCEKGLVAGGRELRRAWEKIDTKAAPKEPPDAKRPLFRELPPPLDYPVDAMGDLGKAARALHNVVRAPLALCAQSVLGAATLMIQAHYDVELPSGRRPLTGIFTTIATSGERKTSTDRRACAPIYDIEKRWLERFEDEQRAYLDDKDAWEAARAKARKSGSRAEIRQKLEAIGPKPIPPPHPMLLVADPTPEALTLHLADGRPWCGVFTSEGGLFIGGAAFSDESRMRTAALLNTLWDGEPIRRVRVLTGRKYLPGRRTSVHLMMQPAVADKVLGDPMLDGIGLLARTLIVAPESTAGTRLWREPPVEAVAAMRDYGARLIMFDREPRMCGDALDPLPLALSPDAHTMWTAFHDHVETEMGDGGAYAPIRAFAAKTAEHAGRLAAVLALYADPDTAEIPAWAMAGGIELAQHYAAELERLIGSASVSTDLRLAQRLLAWWQDRPDPRCHLAAIYQRGLNAIGDAATARRIVAILEEHGWVRRLPPGTVLDGAPRREAWELVP